MSRPYSNRSFNSSHEHPPRRFSPSTHNESAHFQHPPHREINHRHPTVPLSRIASAATTSASPPHYHLQNPTAASFSRRPPWFDSDWEDHQRPTSYHNNHTKRHRPSAMTTATSQSHSRHRHDDRKRSRHDEQGQYQPYANHRSMPNPIAHNRSVQPHHQSPPVVPSSYRPSMPPPSTSSSYTQYHRNGLIFESPSYHPPVYHQTSMSTHIYQRPSLAFLLTDLLHRTVHTHAATYSDNHVHHHPPAASIDLIAYAWMSPSYDIFSLSPAFSIQFGDFFDLTIPDETPVVGLTDTELERLPTVMYSKTSADVDLGDKCAVCLSEYTDGEKLKRLRCKHYFHSECIDPWLKTSTRCPVCRGQQTG